MGKLCVIPSSDRWGAAQSVNFEHVTQLRSDSCLFSCGVCSGSTVLAVGVKNGKCPSHQDESLDLVTKISLQQVYYAFFHSKLNYGEVRLYRQWNPLITIQNTYSNKNYDKGRRSEYLPLFYQLQLLTLNYVFNLNLNLSCTCFFLNVLQLYFGLFVQSWVYFLSS